MHLLKLLKSWRQWFFCPVQPAARRRRCPHSPIFEILEERSMPATHTWSGAVSGLMSLDGNWSTGGHPMNGESGPIVLLFPGTAANFTVVDDLAGLTVDQIQFTGSSKSYVISGGAGGVTLNLSGSALSQPNIDDQVGGNTFSASNLTLALGASAVVQVTTGTLTVSSLVTGTGALNKTGAGDLALTAVNAYGGGTTVSAGTVVAANTQALGSGAATLAGGTLSLQAGGALPTQAFANDVVVKADSTLDVEMTPAVMGNLTIGANLTVTGTGPSLSSGPSLTLGAVTLTANATVSSGPNFGEDLYLGNVTTTAAPAVLAIGVPGIVNLGTVGSGVTLSGNGRIGQPVSIAAGATVDPGAAPGAAGTLTTANDVSFATGSTFHVDIGGYAAGNDVLDVGGIVNLNSDGGTGATLNFSLLAGFNPADGQQFTIIRNTGSNPVVGTFAGLPEGYFLVSNGTALRISYIGGSTGHDVVLSATLQPPVTHFAVTPSVSTALVGWPVTFTVTALDSTNRPTIYTGGVHFTCSDPQATLPPDAMLSNGTGVFNVTFLTPGSQTVTATDTIYSSITGTSPPVTVTTQVPQVTRFAVSAPALITPGTQFNVTVTAQDQFGATVTTYSGRIVLTCTDPAAVLPSGNLSLTNGVGTFIVTLNTAGAAQTITATDSVFPGITGTSNIIQQQPPPDGDYFLVSAPATATTGTPITVTVTAENSSGISTSYHGTVHITSSDGAATLPPDAALSNGTGTFQVTLNTAGNQTVTATDEASLLSPPLIMGTSAAITTRGLVVTGTKVGGSSVQIYFSKPFDWTKLTIYGSGLSTVQDATLVGQTNGAISGTLYLDPANMTATFKATEASLSTFFGTSVLPDDHYTLTLISGTTNGFVDLGGVPLDGADNAGHANYTTTFTVANSGKEVLSLPDFARGPDGAHSIDIPADTPGAGIPVTLSNATAVTDVTFTLSYNPSLLTITGPTSGNLQLVGTPIMFDPIHATAAFSYHKGTAQNGTVLLGGLVASVPNSAGSQYKAKELLQLGNITVNGAAFTGVWANAIHVNAYLGDVTGNGSIDALDVAFANNVAEGASTGFPAFTLLDPAIVGDPQGDISVDAGDVSALAAVVVQLPEPTIPAIPSGLTITPIDLDPTLSLRGEGRGTRGETVSVLLDQPHPKGSTGMTEAILALTFDPTAVSVSASDITLGSIPSLGTGWQVSVVIDAAAGRIAITLYSTTPISTDQPGSLVQIAFHRLSGAAQSASVQLVNSVTIGGQEFVTQIDDDQGRFILSPVAHGLSTFRARRRAMD
jgi:autotransporter-associated beta strand protein